LALLGQRERWTGDDERVFPGELGGYLEGPALRRGTLRRSSAPGYANCASTTCATPSAPPMIAKADILRVMEWMSHADVQTTRGYLHSRPRSDDAKLADEAVAPGPRFSSADAPSAPNA
jgi:hypothetical protein